MKLAEFVAKIVIDERKLTHYVLNKDSPSGKHKAILFENVLGFTQNNYRGLLARIETGALLTEAIFHSEDKYGKRYTVDIPVEGTEGQQATIRTGWLVPLESREAQLITLYVLRR